MTAPNDATAKALAQWAATGSDLSRPMSIDFFVAVPGKREGLAVAAEVTRLGFSASVEQDAESGDWTCYCTKSVIPSYENVTAIEAELDVVARRCGGYLDGFGSFGNGPD